MKLTKLITFLSVKLHYPIFLSIRIAQLLPTQARKFYCFRPGPHIFLKYTRHNHLRCPMVGEASFET